MQKTTRCEIKIHNIDPNVILAIDRQAAACGQSRNAYLISLLSDVTSIKRFEDVEENYKRLVKGLSAVVESNTETLKHVTDVLNDLERLLSE